MEKFAVTAGKAICDIRTICAAGGFWCIPIYLSIFHQKQASKNFKIHENKRPKFMRGRLFLSPDSLEFIARIVREI